MKTFYLIAIFLPCICIAQSNKLIKQALKTTDLNEKINLLTQVIELEPNNLDAYFYRGNAKNDLGDYYSAIVDYSKIIVDKPDADTYFNRGNSRYSLQNFEGAKDDYLKAIELDPNFIDAIFSLACVNYDLEDYDNAIKYFNAVLKIDPYFSKAYSFRANILSNQKKYTDAFNDYSLAIYVDPSVDNYFNRGVFLMHINEYKKAKTDFSSVLKLNESNSFAYFYRGTSNLF